MDADILQTTRKAKRSAPEGEPFRAGYATLFWLFMFGGVAWDYSAHLLNPGGRVSLKMALMWCALGVVFIRLAFPLVKRALRHLQGRGSKLLCAAMTVFMALNLAVTCAALTRWHERGDTPSDSAVIRWIDSTYDDETMSGLFPNMVFTDWP